MNSSQLIKIGKCLKKSLPPQTTITLRRQGAIPYYSELNSIDMLGLMDKKIAKWNYRIKDRIERFELISDYIIEKEPDMIILFPSSLLYEGWIYKKFNGSERYYLIEYKLLKKAVQKGYKFLNSIPLGKEERVVFLSSEDNHSYENKDK